MGSSRWSAASPCNAAKQLTFNALQQFDSHGGRHLEVEGEVVIVLQQESLLIQVLYHLQGRVRKGVRRGQKGSGGGQTAYTTVVHLRDLMVRNSVSPSFRNRWRAGA